MTLSDDVLFASVREQGRLLRTRALSSVELTSAYLDRLESIGPKLGALVTPTRELALAQAKQADAERAAGKARGPLHGIPYGAKDLLATKGIATTWGAEPFKDQVFDYDATAIERLRAAGAVLVGKLAMVELAGGMGYNNPDASFTGPGRTPWNPDLLERRVVLRARARPRRRAWSASRSGPRRPAPSSRPRRSAGSPPCGPRTAWSRATARWRCAGRSTSWARCAGPRTTAGWCWQAIAGPDPKDPTTERPLRLDAARRHAAVPHRRPEERDRPRAAGGAGQLREVPRGAARASRRSTRTSSSPTSRGGPRSG